jgi:hypothetical protein
MLAAHRQGHDVVLWADASAWIRHDPYLIFSHIKEKGYILFDSGWTNEKWCNDRQLAAFGFTRDEAQNQKQSVGGLMGFDFDSEIGQKIFGLWMENIDLFTGNWDNLAGSESNDPRCLGSRHDQAVMSLIVAKLGLTLTDPSEYFTFDPGDKEPIFALQGM